MVVLWTITVYLAQERKAYWVTLIPAAFMTAVITTYLLLAPEGFSLPAEIAYFIGLFLTICSLAAFYFYNKNYLKKINPVAVPLG